MQGYIIKVTRSRDEDLIVSIITQENLQTLYRFYGARHGAINLGFKIDFERELSLNSGIGRLRDVIHLGYPWIMDRSRLAVWQQFIALFHPHLRDAPEIGSFYFELLDAAAAKWHLQNPKRVAIESYLKLLQHEGRLHDEAICFDCESPIEDEVSMIRAFLPTHRSCSHRHSIALSHHQTMMRSLSTLYLGDEEIEVLWYVLLEGL